MDNKKLVKLVLDTRDALKIDGTSKVQFNIANLTRDIKSGSIQWVQLYSLEMANTFYNIISTNNTIAWDVYDAGGTVLLRSTTASIAEGFYTADQVITAVTAAMNAADADTYTMNMDSINDKITITNTSGQTIKFDFEISTIGRVMGFIQDSAIAAAIEGNRMPDVRGLTSFMIKSNIGEENVIRYSGNNGTNDGFTYEVKIDKEYGHTIFWHNNNSLDIHYMSNLPHVIEFELRSRKTTLISNNDFDWKVCLLVSYVV